ncbi:hypothetical protein PHISP_00470 [Aspergillus sp. HF37]|nr:hypothetical protein PHISP_00470 [Aspergillus sp. HF37]
MSQTMQQQQNPVHTDDDAESLSEEQAGSVPEQQANDGQQIQQWQQPQQQVQQPVQQPGQQPSQQPQYVSQNGAVRQSRIKDRPQPKETRDSSLKVKVELDLEAEVDLYARVKGDVTVGLM